MLLRKVSGFIRFAPFVNESDSLPLRLAVSLTWPGARTPWKVQWFAAPVLQRPGVELLRLCARNESECPSVIPVECPHAHSSRSETEEGCRVFPRAAPQGPSL